MGAEVTLITGPVNLTPPSKAKVIPVESAADMYDAVFEQFDSSDVVIMTAAVADYKPKIYHAQKMKKQPGENVIEFERTKDILMELGENKTHQILVGFAAETNNVEEYARGKLVKKNADMIVANNVTVAGAGFGTDTNIVTIYDKDGSATELPKMSKADIAKSILAEVSRMQKE